MKEKGKRKSKAASSSTSVMTSQEKLPAWKPGKIYIP
jgi:hypothetical protein